jgi:hypothetical protein
VNASSVGRFVLGSSLVALAAGAVLTVVAGRFGSLAVGYGLAGWLAMALVGTAAGAWAVARHGKPGPGFIVAVGTGMLARVVLAAIGAGVTVARGEGGIYAYFAGVGAGYVPVQMYEMGWFLRQGRARS